MGRLILTTVGTSLLDTGPRKEKTKEQARAVLNECGLVHQPPWDVLRRSTGAQGRLDMAEQYVLQAYSPIVTCGELHKVSAEIASLGALQPRPREGDLVVLLASDTLAGVSAARCVAMLCSAKPQLLQPIDRDCLSPRPLKAEAQYLEHRRRVLQTTLPAPIFAGAALQVAVVRNLTWDPDNPYDPTPGLRFRESGCFNLAATVSVLIDQRARRLYPEVLCNITGGLKSSIPFVTWVCSLFPGVELVYLYEEASALLRTAVPRLTVPPCVEELLMKDSWSKGEIDDEAAGYFDPSDTAPSLSLFGRALSAYVRVKRGVEQFSRDVLLSGIENGQ